LNKRTSINSIPNILKEKEMADFRKMLFAFAAVALLAGLTVPANAQSACTVGSGVNTLVRAEGYNDLVGDIVLTCTGGVSTAPGVVVPQVDILVTLNGTITSRITATLTGGTGTQMNETLLLMDEPNGTKWNAFGGAGHGIKNCGSNGEDSSPAGPGVCSITAPATPDLTYDGTASPAGVYGTGRPNVFQGRQASVLAGSVANTIQFLGIPYDPPCAAATATCPATRTLRIVNIRVNGNGYGVASPFSTVPVIATISISNNSSISLTNTSVQVGQVEQGLISQFTATTFLQCQSTSSYSDASDKNTSGKGTGTKSMNVRVLENFPNAFKVKNVRQILDNGTFLGTNYQYTAASLKYNTDFDQNVPGAVYGTETGFYFPTSGSTAVTAPPSCVAQTNPPCGFGTPVTSVAIGSRFTDPGNTGGSTGIEKAGLANQGTRIAINLDPAPAGTTIYFPLVVPLLNQANGAQTGVMVLTSTDANGAGAYTPTGQASLPTGGTPPGILAGYGAVTNNNFAVYEVLFSDNNSQEYADIAPRLFYVSNTASNLPPAPSTITGNVSFAPTYAASTGANLPSSSLPEPRFAPSVAANQKLYTLNLCQCNLLFPWIVGGNGYVTSIVVDNTTADPFGTINASGTVTFNYYGTNGVVVDPTNTGTFAAQTTTVKVPAGSYAVDIVTSSGGGGAAGLSSLSGPFAGYVIAQANFQFCHGVASISGNGIQPQTYIGLEMDLSSLNRTGIPGEVLGH
jgi:hypothetical protein